MTNKKDLFYLLHNAFKEKKFKDMFSEEALNYLRNHEDVTVKDGDIKKFQKDLKKKWKSVNGGKERLQKKYQSWLLEELSVEVDPEPAGPSSSTVTPNRGGRPKLLFSDGSRDTKRRRTEDHLLQNPDASLDLLLSAAIKKLQLDGRRQDAIVLRKIMESSEDGTCLKGSKMYSPDEALALLLDCRLSKQDYQMLRSGAKGKGASLYPSYNHVREAKERCIPSSGILVTDYSAEVELQNLLDHTATRIVQGKQLDWNDPVVMISKVGFDGSTGQSIYKQVTSEGVARETDNVEQSLFLMCLVPIQIYDKASREVIYQNDCPSSTNFCRPIRFEYIKETKEVCETALEKLKSAELLPTRLGDCCPIEHRLEFTMFDGKVHTVFSDKTSSSLVCSMCGLTPKNMNNIEYAIHLSETCTVSNLQYGLSTLHAWIRCMECMLHISYKIDIQSWQARGEQKDIVQAQKRRVQGEIKEALGIIVDMPRQGGSGTTNDGNTARRFFSESELVAGILKLNPDLLHRLHVILCVVSGYREVNSERLKVYCLETAQLFITEYPWYYMPQAVHKLLIHSHQVVSLKDVPVGMLSEEAQEASNKKCKNFREFFTRKCSRKDTNMDMMRRLLCASDPHISMMRCSQANQRVKKELPAGCEELLLQ